MIDREMIYELIQLNQRISQSNTMALPTTIFKKTILIKIIVPLFTCLKIFFPIIWKEEFGKAKNFTYDNMLLLMWAHCRSLKIYCMCVIQNNPISMRGVPKFYKWIAIKWLSSRELKMYWKVITSIVVYGQN